MRWLSVGRAAVAIGIAAVVVLAPVPAVAADPIVPVPVQPLPGLPSTTLKGITNAGTVGNATANWYAWMLAQIKSGAAQPGPGGAIVKPSIPVTGPKPVPGVAVGAGSAALSGWFAIGGAGAAVKFVGQVTGADFDTAMCGADSWLQTAYGWLTMGMGPSCVATVLEPNGDVTAALISPVTGAVNVLGRITYGTQNIVVQCYGSPGVEPPSGYNMRGLQSGQVNWSFINVYGSTALSQCKSHFPSAVQSITWPDQYLKFGLSSAANPSVVQEFTQTTADPLRDSTCTLTWPDGSTTEGFVGQYRESEGFPIGAVDAACTEAFVSKPGAGPDLWPSDIKVGSTNPDTGAQTEVIGDTLPDWTPDEKKGLDPGDGTGLKLWKIVDTKKFSCMTWAIDCSNWWTQTDSGSQPQTDTGTYRCTWGGNKVALNECGPYRTTFNDPDLDSRTITDPDGTPQPYPIPGPVPNPVPNPSPQPGTDPGGECFADGWSSVANPLDWVLVPVKCALVWAFSPRKAVVEETFAEAAGKWSRTMPGRIGSIVATAFDVDPVDGCQGPHVFIPLSQYWDGWVDFDAYPLSACDEPASTVAFWSRLIGGVVLVYLTALGIIRRVSATVNAPGVGGGAG